MRDVAGIVAMVGPGLDRAHIERWASELGVMELWQRAQREAASE